MCRFIQCQKCVRHLRLRLDAATELRVGVAGSYASCCGGPSFKYWHVNFEILRLSSVTPSICRDNSHKSATKIIVHPVTVIVP